MKERGIIFNDEMVRAIIDGRKTMTRRPIKGIRPCDAGIYALADNAKCPYGQIGDRLWVRETFTAPMEYNGFKPSDLPQECDFIYREESPDYRIKELGSKWWPSIHMPRWASRITLEITGVRIERVQDISEEDAIAEGIDWKHSPYPAVDTFMCLWTSIYGTPAPGKPDYSWTANPWVWVPEFKRLEKGEE